MTHQACTPGRGRPRAFEPEEALQAALDLFWEKGYEATSLDDLTTKMGLSRSSFYGCFGSKRNVLLAAVRSYAATSLARLEEIEADHQSPHAALAAMVRAIADPDGGPRGCLLVNCITELAPHDPELAALSRCHIERIEGIFARLLSPAAEPAAADRARALMALAIGAITLRKAGLPKARIDALLAEARSLLPSPGAPAA